MDFIYEQRHLSVLIIVIIIIINETATFRLRDDLG